MHDERSCSIPYEARLGVEAAILALVLAEDWPWHATEIATRLCLPRDLIGFASATLLADGLLVAAPARSGNGGGGSEALRASWAAVRGAELLRHCPRNHGPTRSNVERCLLTHGAARLFVCRQEAGENSAPNHG